MSDTSNAQAMNDYWGRDGLGQAILDALVASGKQLDALTVDDLAPTDQFLIGGLHWPPISSAANKANDIGCWL